MPKIVHALALILSAASLACTGAAVAQGTAVAPATGQPATGAAAPAGSADQPSTEEVLTAAIGCLATYDMVLSKGETAKTPKTKAARQAAYDLYKQYTNETDAQVQADVTKADGIFPGMVANGSTKLEDFEASCDNAFMEIAETSPSPAAPAKP